MSIVNSAIPFRFTKQLCFYGSSILKEVATPVRDVLEYNFGLLAREMAEIMYGLKGVGLSGNQIGIAKRIIVIDLLGSPLTMLNPYINTTYGGITTRYEGCLSLPGVERLVKRSQYISVEYKDLDFKVQVLNLIPTRERDALSYENISRVIQHEVDHLNGTLIIDKED